MWHWSNDAENSALPDRNTFVFKVYSNREELCLIIILFHFLLYVWYTVFLSNNASLVNIRNVFQKHLKIQTPNVTVLQLQKNFFFARNNSYCLKFCKLFFSLQTEGWVKTMFCINREVSLYRTQNIPLKLLYDVSNNPVFSKLMQSVLCQSHGFYS